MFGFSQKLSENPGIPGPTLEYFEGDSVVIDLWNISQSSTHTIHLHGLDVNQENDGVPHLSFEVDHMEHGFYRFMAPHSGTYLYHCHVVSSIHVQAGMYGMLIIHPKDEPKKTWKDGYSYRSSYNFLYSEIDSKWHTDSVLEHSRDHSKVRIPRYDPEYFLANGKSETEWDSLGFPTNENTYLRLANLGFMGNRIIFPSTLNAKLIDSDGRPLPTPIFKDTLFVYPGERYGVLLTPTKDESGEIDVSYLDMNTHIIKNSSVQKYAATPFIGVEQTPNNFLLYPNPTTGELYISAGTHNISFIEIWNVNGCKVHSFKVDNRSEIHLNVRSLPMGDGLYLLKILTENGEVSWRKVIVL